MTRIHACGLSDVGRIRSQNEDFFVIDEENGLYAVADGMGGHGHGDVASRVAVSAVSDFIQSQSADGPGSLRRAIVTAHRRLLEEVEREPRLMGMGTTLVGMMVGRDRAAVAHVGDSRAYRLSADGELELLTRDHSWVNEQVEAGYLSPDQARAHPLKSVVTRALGGEGELEVDLRELELTPGDLFLICSDGLTSMLADEEIGESLSRGGTLEEICGDLVRRANRRGGLDNITVVVLAVEEQG